MRAGDRVTNRQQTGISSGWSAQMKQQRSASSIQKYTDSENVTSNLYTRRKKSSWDLSLRRKDEKKSMNKNVVWEKSS
jgi:hypothetical protein